MSDSEGLVHHREPLWVESGMDSLKEWASEGESKKVDETERTLRYQIRHMTVCNERVRKYQAGWHRRRTDSCPSMDWDRFFYCLK